MFSQVLEAVRALEEGVLEDIREGDVGAILGWGFAPGPGGPFSWLDIIGTPYAAERCDQLQRNSATVSSALPCCAKWPPRARRSTAASVMKKQPLPKHSALLKIEKALHIAGLFCWNGAV